MIDDHSVETPDTNNEPALDDLLNDLLSESEHTRLTAVQTMSRLAPATELSLRNLEKTAAQDQSQVVRQAALTALTNPAYRDMQRQTSRLPASARQTMLTEIGRWQADGSLSQQINLVRRQQAIGLPPLNFGKCGLSG